MTPARHILYAAPFGLRHKTTVWARTLPLARSLVAQGWRCTIVVPPWDAPEDGGLRENHAGVEIVQVNVEGGLPAIAGRLWREVAMRAPDIVHCVKPRAYAGILQWLLWQQRRRSAHLLRPALALDLDDWEQAWQAVNHYPPATARFLAWQEEWGIRHADAITVASRWLETRAREYAPHTPVLYLPNGVEIAEESAAHTPRVNRANVLFFTRFVEVDPAWFRRFVVSLFQLAPEACLMVAGSPLHEGGDAPFRAHLPADLQTRVVWLGHVAPAALPGVYAASQVAIFPAAPTVLQLAKCSVRLATTLLHGVPVVASAVGEQANYGQNGAASLVAADASPEEFAAATTALLRNAPAQTQMIASARQHLAETYQWHSLAARLAAFYSDLLAARSRLSAP